ncbi:MAG: mobilization protein [Cytophagaceae bacterium SCN 52-12]|nr:MAG: mobilization protein [Cytophagaceae bacterium SCN 52-12]
MEQKEKITKRKGGRPRKAVRKEHVLALKCSLFEKKAISVKAKSVNLSVSEYLRQMALSGKVNTRVRVLPKEVLMLTARLNHISANLNQIARKRNGTEELKESERANLQAQSGELKELTDLIKSSLR